jgi:hypothetical protein
MHNSNIAIVIALTDYIVLLLLWVLETQGGYYNWERKKLIIIQKVKATRWLLCNKIKFVLSNAFVGILNFYASH